MAVRERTAGDLKAVSVEAFLAAARKEIETFGGVQVAAELGK